MIIENKTLGFALKSHKLENGNVWFKGSDVAKKLGYKDTAKAIQERVNPKNCTRADGIFQLGDVIGAETLAKTLEIKMNNFSKTKLINKYGVRELIFSSRLPEAQAIKDWFLTTVWDSLEKYGAYTIGEENLPKELREAHQKAIDDSVKEVKANLYQKLYEQEKVITTMQASALGLVKTMTYICTVDPEDEVKCLDLPTVASIANAICKDAGMKTNFTNPRFLQSLQAMGYLERFETTGDTGSYYVAKEGMEKVIRNLKKRSNAKTFVHITENGLLELLPKIVEYDMITKKVNEPARIRILDCLVNSNCMLDLVISE